MSERVERKGFRPNHTGALITLHSITPLNGRGVWGYEQMSRRGDMRATPLTDRLMDSEDDASEVSQQPHPLIALLWTRERVFGPALCGSWWHPKSSQQRVCRHTR